ncbi:MAG: hypothetical protein IJD01_00675 [Clostridia bacterium]|nr:hypothetical protein [Clostridia bacterium]
MVKVSRDSLLLILCVAEALSLCTAQVIGNSAFIMFCLGAFMLLVGYAAFKGYAAPVLMFFLPWSTILKISQGSLSFFTFALLMVCGIYWLKERFLIHRYYILFSAGALLLTVFSKLLSAYSFDNSYLMFMALLFLFPLLMKEIDRNYDFRYLTVLLSVGIIVAALTAQYLVIYPNIAKYIDVYSFRDITRLSGYYGDPNFYSAHITAALAGVMMLLMKKTEAKERVWLILLAVVLVYCGLLSASKAFVLLLVCLAFLLVMQALFMRGKMSLKLSVILGVVFAIVFLLTSELFSDLISVIQIRFGDFTNLSDLTTGRSEIWESYAQLFSEDAKTLLIGQGFTNVKHTGWGSHNTVLQLVYQFGIVGIGLLVGWFVSYYRTTFSSRRLEAQSWICVVILLVGVLGPWMSIDILFFDEFFLMQFYLLAGLYWMTAPKEAS